MSEVGKATTGLVNRRDLVCALGDFREVVVPDRDEPNWWAGAPSVVYDGEGDGEDGEFWLAVRMRTAEGKRGSRGYELRILRSRDGDRFAVASKISRDDTGVAVFERPSLVLTPERKFRLYGCSSFLGSWAVWKLDDADDPTAFDPGTLEVVLHAPPRDTPAAALQGFKDPFVTHIGGRWHMFVIGEAHKSAARPYHFTSGDGVTWEPWPADLVGGKPGSFFSATGWHSWSTRPACVVPLGVGYLLAYEGSHLNWHDAVYNLATGLAYSPDLTHWHDLTPDAPLLVSTTPGNFHTWRYSHWLPVGGEMHVYWEGARPNDTFATRHAKFPLDSS
ncbi:MAG: hypothetical protein ACTSU5_09185 [Promethearchaeota archaeon]